MTSISGAGISGGDIAARPRGVRPTGRRADWLGRAGAAWFVVAAIGQFAFVWFIAAFYGTRTASGDLAGWNDKPLITGHVPGDAAGNAMFAAHVLMAAVITLGGLVQLVPQIRNRARAFHRWNGRVFIVMAYAMALGGLWLTWGRGTFLSWPAAVAISGDAILILVFVTLAWRTAAARRMEAHRRWAMRAYLAANGVWFLRVGMMAWILLNQGQRGMNDTMSGPADIALNFGCYLIPLAILELWFAARRSARPAVRAGATALMLVATLVTTVGVFGTVALMWGPYL